MRQALWPLALALQCFDEVYTYGRCCDNGHDLKAVVPFSAWLEVLEEAYEWCLVGTAERPPVELHQAWPCIVRVVGSPKDWDGLNTVLADVKAMAGNQEVCWDGPHTYEQCCTLRPEDA